MPDTNIQLVGKPGGKVNFLQDGANPIEAKFTGSGQATPPAKLRLQASARCLRTPPAASAAATSGSVAGSGASSGARGAMV